ncbi:hypothetical protein Tco_1312424 [Tanacetum coccineum]
MIRFKKKLQALKKVIRAWVADFKKSQMEQRTDIITKLQDIDIQLDQGGVNDDILLDRMRRSNLAIKGVMVDSTWVDDPSHVKNEFCSHFATRFQSSSGNRVWACGENKSPGPDGFTFEFFRKFWDVLGKDFLQPCYYVIFDHCRLANELKFSIGKASVIGLMAVRLQNFNFIVGISFNESVNISHLFYADDAVFIGEWSRGNLSRVMHALHCFSLASGLKINVHKSHLLGVGIPNDTVAIVASDLGCSTMTTPFKYLGVMVGENMAKVSAWDDVVRKIKSRLSKWKIKTLSIGGRLTLLKSVLGATPIYWMSLFKVPNSVLASMEALRREFFYGAQSNEKKITWWSRLRSPTPYAPPWYSIVREIQNLKNKGVEDKDCYVASKFHGSVDLSFRRAARGGVEAQQFAQLRDMLDTVILSNLEDRWRWDLNGSGSFRVCDVRNLLDEFFLPKDERVTRCPMASDIHRLICRWWGLPWSPLGSYAEWLSWFKDIRLGSKVKSILEGVCYVSWWCLWIYRNQLLFATVKPRKDKSSLLFVDDVDFLCRKMGCRLHVHTYKTQSYAKTMRTIQVQSDQCLSGRLSNGQTGIYVESRFFLSSSVIFVVLCWNGIITVFCGIVVYRLRLPPLRDLFLRHGLLCL